MAKSFKKVIACLLSALMVMVSVPFSALAADVTPTVTTTDTAIADTTPDLQLEFGTFFDMETSTNWTTPYGKLSKKSDFTGSGLFSTPLTATATVDPTTGKYVVTALTLEESKAQAYADWWNDPDGDMMAEEYDPFDDADGDVAYAKNNYFTVTARIDNVQDITAVYASLGYSANIEPAGVYVDGKTYKLITASQYDALTEGEEDAEWTFAGTNCVEEWSNALQPTKLDSMEDSFIDNTNRIMRVVLATQSGSPVINAGNYTSESAIDPATGEKGRTFSNSVVAATFLFKIVDTFNANNPIEFTVYDPDNTKYDAYAGAAFTAKDGDSWDYYSTYATNSHLPAGSQKFYFFGYNVNSGNTLNYGGGGAPHTHNMEYHQAVPATCTEDGTVAYYSCSGCNKNFADEQGNTELTTIVDPATGHNYGQLHAAEPATCTANGKIAYYQCSKCQAYFNADKEAVDSIVDPATGHNYGQLHAAVAPTCITDGNIAYYQCSKCQAYFNADKEAVNSIVDAKTGVHVYGEWQQNDAETHIRYCTADTNCTASDTQAHVPAAAVDENYTAPTVTDGGYVEHVVYCSVCHYEISRTPENLDPLGEDKTFVGYEIDTAKEEAKAKFTGNDTGDTYYEDADLDIQTDEPSCTVDGQTTYTASYQNYEATAANGGIVIVPIEAPGHSYGELVAANPATCTEAGTIAYYQCSVCQAYFDADKNEVQSIVDPAKGHDMTDWAVSKEATIYEAGEEERHCQRAGCDYSETRPVESLDITVTVKANALGTATLEDAKGSAATTASADAARTYKFGDSYTVTAEAKDTNVVFVGWKVNGKLVSESVTYRAKAFNDITIEPIFEGTDAEEFTVIFYDLYKNVVSEQSVKAASELKVPSNESMARKGYTFLGWDKDPATIEGAAIITGQYEETTDTYKVTVAGDTAGQTVTINGEAVSELGVPYDSKVTVYASNATGWKIGETVVAEGDTYTFYVASNVTVTAVYEAVEVEPAITIVNNELVSTDSYRCIFVASRVVPDGYKVEKLGFIYGKNLTQEELVLENVGNDGKSANAGKVKIAYNNVTSVLETSLQYGIKNKDANACAVAFMVISKGGKSEVKYSPISVHDYTKDTNVDPTNGNDD